MKTDAAKYFYASANGRRGPIACNELRALAVAGTLTRRHKVWCEGMPGWETADKIDGLFAGLPPDFQDGAPPALPPPLPEAGSRIKSSQGDVWSQPAPSPSSQPSSEFLKGPRTIFMAAFPIAGVFFATGNYWEATASYGEVPASALICYVLGLGAMAFAFVNWMKVHFRMWQLLPPVFAATTPGKAVGFLFIPLFNLYWFFVSFRALAQGANKTLGALKERRGFANDGLALAFSIVMACWVAIPAIMPILQFPLMIGIYVLWILFYNNLAVTFEEISKHAPPAIRAAGVEHSLGGIVDGRAC